MMSFGFMFYTTIAVEPFSSEIGNMRFCDARTVSAETQMKHLANIKHHLNFHRQGCEGL